MKALGWVSAIAVFSVLGWAQAVSTSQIRGTVQDSTGASVPDAQVKVTQTDTGFKRDVVTDADGLFSFPNIPIGPYRLEVMLQGFERVKEINIGELEAAVPPQHHRPMLSSWERVRSDARDHAESPFKTVALTPRAASTPRNCRRPSSARSRCPP